MLPFYKVEVVKKYKRLPPFGCLSKCSLEIYGKLSRRQIPTCYLVGQAAQSVANAWFHSIRRFSKPRGNVAKDLGDQVVTSERGVCLHIDHKDQSAGVT